jgi:hypothetical protein
MHLLYAGGIRFGLPRPQRLEPGGGPPPLRGARMGNRGVGKLTGQLQTNQPRSPAGVGALHRQSGVVELLGRGRAAGAAAVVVDFQTGLAVVAIAIPDRAHGAILLIELARDLGQGDPVAAQLDDLLPDRERNGTGHRRPPGTRTNSRVTAGSISHFARSDTTCRRRPVTQLYSG